jgi:hypothetical protein
LARMFVDGHFPEWHETETPEAAMQQALVLFMRRISAADG